MGCCDLPPHWFALGLILSLWMAQAEVSQYGKERQHLPAPLQEVISHFIWEPLALPDTQVTAWEHQRLN